MAMTCRYGDLVSAAARLANLADLFEDIDCDETAEYKAIIATDNDGFVIDVTTPVCPVHEAHVSHNTAYKRSIKLRAHTTT